MPAGAPGRRGRARRRGRPGRHAAEPAPEGGGEGGGGGAPAHPGAPGRSILGAQVPLGGGPSTRSRTAQLYDYKAEEMIKQQK